MTGAPRPTTIGAVLVGGQSTRMGADKASLDVAGTPLGARSVRALEAAGLTDVMLVGATAAHGGLGGRVVEDLWPGEGPVGAVLTALHAAFLVGATHVVCLACDLPAVTADAVRPLLDVVEARQAVLVAVDGRPAPPNGVWPVALLPALEDRFGDGASSFRELLDGVDVLEVDGGAAFVDADEPGDLAPFQVG
ncbi:MAG: molybdenum cofactor guanylyltransferase [Microthrixaceae bacterium]